MKKYINRNYFWSDLLVHQLLKRGITNVSISPGSRNTPLTMAFARNKKFKKLLFVDERSNGFFSLGIAKESGQAAVIITTSGTAVAELYPAIIESYYQRIPLIICTADRPEFLRNSGANQTINQENIFRNHIRYFKDCGLPDLKENKLKKYVADINTAIDIATDKNPGPVHLNFPFQKPLEPNAYTDKIEFKISEFVIKTEIADSDSAGSVSAKFLSDFRQCERPVIHCAWDRFDNKFYRALSELSLKYKIPVLTDGTSEFRFTQLNNKLVITNHSSYINLLSENPDFVIQFGNAPTSKQILSFMNNTSAKKYYVNFSGEIKDPSIRKGQVIKLKPEVFLKYLLKNGFNKSWGDWSNYLLNVEKICEDSKSLIHDSSFGSEPRIINEILRLLPEKSNLFISNSLPVRDFDYFASKRKSGVKIFTNRGASGIDGIISTASGIACYADNPTFLIIGDLAFYHNLAALSTLDQQGIPLKIILINNGGGGIFRMLPISSENEFFDECFLTPQKLNYKKITKAFNGDYFSPRTWQQFRDLFERTLFSDRFSVIEFISNAEKSMSLRKEYWKEVQNRLYGE